MNRKLKKKIVRDARKLFRERFPHVDEKAACLYLTFCTLVVANRYGLRLIPQAGSASWMRVRRDQDDGVCATHFSYVWEPDNPATLMLLAQGRLPEMHVWAADPQAMEIIDLTTGSLPEQCENLTGVDWPGERLPDYLWGGRDDMPDGTYYHVDPMATQLVGNMMVDIAREATG